MTVTTIRSLAGRNSSRRPIKEAVVVLVTLLVSTCLLQLLALPPIKWIKQIRQWEEILLSLLFSRLFSIYHFLTNCSLCPSFHSDRGDILICGNCRELFNGLGKLLEHRRTNCQLRVICECRKTTTIGRFSIVFVLFQFFSLSRL